MYDILALVGLVALGVGLAMISTPLALSVVGSLLIVAGVAGAWRKGGQP